MSSLWRAWVDQDADRFRRLLAPATHGAHQNVSKSPHVGSGGGAGASPGPFGTSPRTFNKTRKGLGSGPGAGAARASHTTVGKAEVNSRDYAGLSILLRAASSTSELAVTFVQLLLEHPSIDLHVQDPESGWNALHRALYTGNISIARLLLEKERQDLTGQVGAPLAKAGRLIRTKDHEGLSPFDLYNSTIGERDLQFSGSELDLDDESDVEELGTSRGSGSSEGLCGSELFVFGSNKNLTLGLGDEDDRQYPERVYLQRPSHLLQRLYDEYLGSARTDASAASSSSLDDLPTLTRYRDLLVQDVVLSKYHSAILTTDPVSNLYVCGVGRGGRLGLGDENTRFTYTPVQGGLANKKVVQIALGQNHTMAICEGGELWNWGSNANSVLGYSLPEPANKGEEPFIATPRQVFGSLKKEAIVGIAASTLHSVAHTSTALYCWGKNLGQLALMDADSRSLEVQSTPRRVAASLLSAPILQVSVIDKATTCLLDNHTVIVFTAYGYNVVKFPFGETLSSHNLGNISMSSRHDPERNLIKSVTSGGETIVAVTGRGDLFHMNLVTPKVDNTHFSASTTNPAKIKGAVSQPVCIWTAHKDGVGSVDVGEHGAVIISTLSGAVWRRVKRAKAKDSFVTGAGDAKHKDFKFQRVPGITNIVAVRSSAFGAYAAIRKDAEVIREQIKVDSQSLWDDLAPLNSLKDFKSSNPSSKKDTLTHWDSARLQTRLGSVAYEVLKSADLDADMQSYLSNLHYGQVEKLDTFVCTSSSPDLKIPVHGWLLEARSSVLRRACNECRICGTYGISECLTAETVDGVTLVTFLGIDLIALLNLVLFIYEDRVIPAWNFTRQQPSLAFRYRQVRTDVVKFASRLEMSKLEVAAQKQIDPERSLDNDMRVAIEDPAFFDNADAILNLDGGDLPVHSGLLRQRCAFFEALFHGRSQGAWLGTRRAEMEAAALVPVDMEHIEPETFQYVLRYLYADVGSELFDDVVCDSVDDFSDLVMDVLNVANELMLSRLSQICQQILSRFVNTRNVAHYLNAISSCSETAFKDAGLEYIALQAENFLENNLLESLDEEVMEQLDDVVKENQLARSPFARSGRAELILHEQHPELAQDIDEERQRRAKEMAFKANQKEEERKLSSSLKARSGSLEDFTPSSSSLDKSAGRRRTSRNEPFSPDLRPKSTQADLMFKMDDDDEGPVDSPSARPQRVSDNRMQSELDLLPSLSGPYRDEKPKVAGQSWVSPQVGTTPVSSRVAGRSPVTTPGKSGNPWAPAVLPTAKLDLREIMGESSPGPSALSAGLAAQNAKDAAKPQQAKMSQKERKKQQQLQAEQAAKMPLIKTPWDNPPADATSSPWKTVSSASKPTIKDTVTEQSPMATSNPKPLLAVETTARSISRRTQSPDTRHSGQSRTPTTKAHPVRPHSKHPTTAPTPPTTSTFSVDDPTKRITPHSKSYFTPAAKSESTLGLGMSDIIELERRKREAVKEAAAKRSLMEIQQEQEFQEWWDEESRRTQEEEAKRLANQKEREEGRARGRRGRGGKVRGGRGAGAGPVTAVGVGTGTGTGTDNGEGEARQQSQEAGRGRGARRGRGRGGPANARASA